MFCQNCGKKQNDDAKFCENCGTATGGGAPAQPSLNTQQLVGFSQKINDPVFEKLRKKNFRRSMKHGCIFFPILLLLFQIIPFFSDDFSRPRALLIGCIVGGFGLVWTLLAGMFRAAAKNWDGEVVDKKIIEDRSEDRNGHVSHDYYHTLYFRLANGGKKKMRQRFSTGDPRNWDMMVYLNVGDKVRYHGKLDYFEKYDKSRDTEVPCANCKKYIDLRLDHCPACQVPVVKP